MSALPLDPDIAGTLLESPAPIPLRPVHARRVARAHPNEDPPARVDPERWFGSFSLALVEVMTGSRQAQQLIRWLSPDIYTAVARRSGLFLRLHGRPNHPMHARLLAIRVSETASGDVEVCAVVHDGTRVRAVAGRLEVFRDRWRVTQLQVG